MTDETRGLRRAVQCLATGNGGAINVPEFSMDKGTLVQLSKASSEVLASCPDGSRSQELAALRVVLSTSRAGFDPDAAARFNMRLLLRFVSMAMRSCVDESNFSFLLTCAFGLSDACGRRLFVDEVFDFLCATLSSARAQARRWSLSLLLESYVRDSEIHRVDLSAKLCQACAQLPSVLICSSEVSDEWVTEVALATAIIGALPNNLAPSTENSDVQHEARFDSALLLLQSCPHQDMLAAAAIAPLLRRGNQASLERTETTVLQVSLLHLEPNGASRFGRLLLCALCRSGSCGSLCSSCCCIRTQSSRSCGNSSFKG